MFCQQIHVITFPQNHPLKRASHTVYSLLSHLNSRPSIKAILVAVNTHRQSSIQNKKKKIKGHECMDMSLLLLLFNFQLHSIALQFHIHLWFHSYLPDEYTFVDIFLLHNVYGMLWCFRTAAVHAGGLIQIPIPIQKRKMKDWKALCGICYRK